MSETIDLEERERLLTVLGLDKEATWETIQSTYIQLMTVWNPDRFHDDLKLKIRIRKKTSEIKIAFARLEELSGAFTKLQALEEQRTGSKPSGEAFDLAKDLRSDSMKMFKSPVFREAEPPEEPVKEQKKVFETSTSLGSSLSHDDLQLTMPAATPTTLRQRCIATLLSPLRAARRNLRSMPSTARRYYLRAGSRVWMRATVGLTALVFIAPYIQRFDMDQFLMSWMGQSAKQRSRVFDQHVFNRQVEDGPAASYYASFEGSALSRLRLAATGSAGPSLEPAPSIAGPAPLTAKQIRGKKGASVKEQRTISPGLYVAN